ncbi:CsbD family protein [Methylobacterium sp. P5_C11]
MTEDTSSTSTDHLKGSVKEALGKLTGDIRVEAEGRRQKREARAAKSVATPPAKPRGD